jgi:hypothetical protein
MCQLGLPFTTTFMIHEAIARADSRILLRDCVTLHFQLSLLLDARRSKQDASPVTLYDGLRKCKFVLGFAKLIKKANTSAE